jgi:hypothetical protein
MTTTHYSDAQGSYVGGFADGAQPPEGAIERPAPPRADAVWGGSGWAVPQSPQPTLEEARAAASMSRLDFAKLALREGWITAAEAKAWVPGNALPQIVTDIIAQHIEGADKQDIAEINALGQLVVNRNDLLLRLLMMSKKVTDAQMDTHFGIAG